MSACFSPHPTPPPPTPPLHSPPDPTDFSLPLQADGLKEGDYIVAVGDTDVKWLGLTEVMRLLKDVGEEGIDIQVVSVMENNPSMVSVDLVFTCLVTFSPLFSFPFCKVKCVLSD